MQKKYFIVFNSSMRLYSQNNSISFAKKLMAQCNVLNRGKKMPCMIYEINKDDDFDYFDKHENLYWKNGKYWKTIKENFGYLNDKWHVYVIEDKNEKCLGFAKTMDDDTKVKLVLLETRPDIAGENKAKKIKYVSETMLSFITGLALKNNCAYFYVSNINYNARDFYAKCHFNTKNGLLNAILKKDDFKEMIEQNSLHTKSEINYLV